MAYDLLRWSVAALDLAVLAYFLALNSSYLLFAIVAFVTLRRHRRRWTGKDLDAIVRSPATPGISLIVPTFNEAATISESVRSLLMLNYPQYEVVVVNDGSRDETVAVALNAFELVVAEQHTPRPIETRPIRGIYRSLAHPELMLVDKENGGKADAINAGLNAARHDLVCVIDADSLLEPHALTRAVLPFIEDPTTIAAGGIIRIVNGCRVVDGRVVEVGMPRNVLASLQVVEYLRAFLAGRVAQSAMQGLLVVSGAFGIFRRDALLRAGGFDTTTVGEDMEVVVRLHRLYREERRPYRIAFRPDPVCWTEAPERIAILARQRNRWQRGTLQTLSRHRAMIGRPRYGVIGLVALPYYLIFEALGPVLEVAGYPITIAAIAFGVLDWRFAELLFLVAICYGALISLAAVLLEELSFRRYPRVRDLLFLAALGVLENFGYRQLTTWWRLRGIVDFVRGKNAWGAMPRRGFQGRPSSTGTS